MQGQIEILHADTVDDLLSQADELISKGYKDASAVISGSALESHLRLLSTKYDISIMQGSPEKFKKADSLNSELTKSGAYNAIQQKSVTAWLGIRNAAAHGEYEKYDQSEVRQSISAIRDFIALYPA